MGRQTGARGPGQWCGPAAARRPENARCAPVRPGRQPAKKDRGRAREAAKP